jgi:hypothetical protein
MPPILPAIAAGGAKGANSVRRGGCVSIPKHQYANQNGNGLFKEDKQSIL